jgi:hypothetical protein
VIAFVNMIKCRAVLGFTSIDFIFVNKFNPFIGSVHFEHHLINVNHDCFSVQYVGSIVLSV